MAGTLSRSRRLLAPNFHYLSLNHQAPLQKSVIIKTFLGKSLQNLYAMFYDILEIISFRH